MKGGTVVLKQADIFDLEAGTEEKEKGMAEAAGNPSRAEVLEVARYYAAVIARRRPDRWITADDVQQAIMRHGYSPDQVGPAAGSLFRGKAWRFTGHWLPSARASNHGRMVRVWEYVG